MTLPLSTDKELTLVPRVEVEDNHVAPNSKKTVANILLAGRPTVPHHEPPDVHAPTTVVDTEQ
jgi:hypothetical protein